MNFEEWVRPELEREMAARKAKMREDFERQRIRNAEQIDLERLKEGTAGYENPQRPTLQKSRLDLINDRQIELINLALEDAMNHQKPMTISGDSGKRKIRRLDPRQCWDLG